MRIFPPGAPLLTILAGVLLHRFSPLPLGIPVPPVWRYLIGGVLLVGSIYVLGFRAVRSMRATGQSENPYRPTTELLVTGPYRFTRNPMYLQMVLVCIAAGILLGNAWILILTPVCAILLQVYVIRHEEAYLERKFGEAYLTYKSQVRRWI